MAGSVFVLDSNVFIEAARRYYAFDLAPRFWEILVEQAAIGQVHSVDKVKNELERGNDELSDWASNNFSEAFASTDKDKVTQSYGEIINWVNAQTQFKSAAKAEFAQAADGWVVAYAKAKKLIVVTHEVPAPDAKRKVPIPNVCQAFKIPFVDTFEMLRRLGVQWAR
jgi:hypothetical protein